MNRLAGVLVAGLLVVACGSGTPPDAAKVLRDAAAAMAGLSSASATLKLTKGTISIQGFTLVSAQTSVRLPNDSDTSYRVKERDISFAVEVLITGGKTYIRLPLTNFTPAPAAQAAEFPDMAKLFSSATGLPAVIPGGSNQSYVSTDQIDGKDSYQVATTYTPAQVRSLLNRLDSSGPVAAKVWVGTTDHLIRKATLEGAFGDSGKDAAVEVDISNFNAAVTISSPTP